MLYKYLILVADAIYMYIYTLLHCIYTYAYSHIPTNTIYTCTHIGRSGRIDLVRAARHLDPPVINIGYTKHQISG